MSRPPDGGGRTLVVVAVIYAVVEVSQAGPVATAHGLPSPWAATQVLALATLALAVPHLRLAWSPVLTAALLIIGAQTVSILAARDQQATVEVVAGTARDTLTLVVVFVLLAATGSHRTVIAACTGTLAVLAATGVFQELILGNSTELGGLATVVDPGVVGAATPRHAGPVGDANFWARVLVLFLPFAGALALAARARRARLGWGAAGLALLAGVWLTQSRGGMLAAGAALVALLAAAGPRYRRWLLAVPVVLAAVLVFPATGSRLATLTDLTGSPTGEVDESLLLRERAQETALRMVRDDPVLGVGAGNYETVAAEVEREIDVQHLGQIEKGVAPHNAFLEAAAETGLPGLAVWLVFLGTIGFVALRALLVTRPPPGDPPGPDHLMAAACLAGLVGWVVASTVLHVAQYRTLLVFAGIAAALDLAVSRRTVARPTAPATPLRRRDLRPVAIGLLLLAAVAATGIGRGMAREWRGEGTVAVVAREAGPSSLGAYEYQVLGRPGVMRTLGFVAGDPARVRDRLASAGLDPGSVTTQVETRATSTVMHIVVEGPDRDTVLLALGALRSSGALAVNRLDIPFVASPAGEVSVREVTTVRIDGVTVAVTGLALVGWTWWVWATRLRRQFPRRAEV